MEEIELKKLIFSAALVLSLGLAGCGEDAAKDEKTKEETKTTASTEKKDAGKKENVYEDNDIKGIDIYSEEVNISGQSGPLKYNIEKVELKKATPKSEEAANIFGVPVGEEVSLITISMNGENTSSEDMSFYLGQATIITNTKEQLEPEMFLSEHIEGDYLGQVKHEGINVYVLKNSKVEDLKTIEIRVNAPTDSNMGKQGENIIQTIEVNK